MWSTPRRSASVCTIARRSECRTLPYDVAAAVSRFAALSLLDALPPVDLPGVADVAVVDDGSAATGEVMNLLARRNLLFEVVAAPSSRVRINIALGSAEYPLKDAANPSGFAQKIRRQLTDE